MSEQSVFLVGVAAIAASVLLGFLPGALSLLAFTPLLAYIPVAVSLRRRDSGDIDVEDFGKVAAYRDHDGQIIRTASTAGEAEK